ncbi:GOLPH3/VPS74 family protein [Actinomycetes bacterium M1A6_2h]
MTLIAEDVMLLLLDDGSGKPIVDSTKLPRVLAGALVLELAMTGVLRVSEDGEQVKKGRLLVTDAPPPTDPLLYRVADAVAASSRPMTPKRAIEKLQKGLRDEVASRLVDQGFVDQKRGKILGLFPTTTWPARNSAYEAGIRHALYGVLVDGLTPQPRLAAVISLLCAIDAVGKVAGASDRRAVTKRAKQIADGDFAGVAVRKAVQDVNAALMVAMMVPVITAGGSS